jgi:DNA-binding NtrC family response regulator
MDPGARWFLRALGDFEAAQQGTIFLDEIGELPLYAQVKLLRVLQESEVKRVGSSNPIKLNVRVIISSTEIRQALLPDDPQFSENILNRPFGGDLNLRDVLSEVARHYLARALEASNGNKVEASKLVGFPNYQTFSNWLARYGIAASEPSVDGCN